MPFRVVILPHAEADIAAAERFLMALGTSSLARWHERLARAISALESNAMRFPEAYEAADLGFDLRENTFGRRPHVYRVLFVVEDQTVRVYRIRHGAQDRLTEFDI